MIHRAKDDFDRKPVVGDQMYYRDNWTGDVVIEGLVEKITPSGIVRLSGGRSVGPDGMGIGLYRTQMFVVTDAIREEVRRRQEYCAITRKLRSVNWDNLTLQELHILAELLERLEQSRVKEPYAAKLQ